MRAVVYEKYGGPDVLHMKDIPKPAPRNNEILIKVYATSVTAGDWRMRKADPFLARLFNGLLKPRRAKILGFELAGVVEQVGTNVESFKVGDQVFASCGFRFGAYAEYTCLPDNDQIMLKPAKMSFEEAATVPIGGLTALRLLRQAGLKGEDSVMIYGASGSVGTYAIQIAKAYGATVTAICSSSNLDLVKSLGADEVVDYTKEDYSALANRFDVILDAVGKASKKSCKKLLKSSGKYVSVSGSPKSNKDDMAELKRLIEAEKLMAVIDRTYDLSQIREAHQYVESFRKRGNVSIKVAQD